MDEVVSEKTYNQSLKTLIQREFFPEVAATKNEDESLKNFTLQTFTDTFIAKEDKEFTDSIERERQILRSLAPSSKSDKKIENDTRNPWKRDPYNTLFFSPPSIDITPQLALTYNKKKHPQIIAKNTRLPTDSIDPYYGIRRAGNPFTTESSTTDSESEFEGRSKFRKEVLTRLSMHVQGPSMDRIQKLKHKKQLSEKGKELLAKLQS